MYQSITLPDKHDCCTCWETYLCQLVFTKTRALHCVITRDAASQQNVSGFGWNYIPWKIGKKSMYLHLFESIDTKDKRARRLLLLRTSTLNNKLNIHIRPHRKKPKCYKRESTLHDAGVKKNWLLHLPTSWCLDKENSSIFNRTVASIVSIQHAQWMVKDFFLNFCFPTN